jgi:hypothetical protein
MKFSASMKRGASVPKFFPYQLCPTSAGALAVTSPENASLTR